MATVGVTGNLQRDDSKDMRLEQDNLAARMSDALAKPGPLRDALRQLDRLGRRARMLLLSRRAFGLVASVAGVVAVAVAIDWVFRFPSWFRAIGLFVGLAFFASAAVKLLLPAWRFRPSPTDLALRVERTAPALRGRLASGIEFALSESGRESPLAERAMVDLAERLSGESLLSWLAPRRSLAELTTALLTVAVVGLISLIVPEHAAIGVKRVLLPFVGAEWPARTAIESLLGGGTHHAKGEPLLLQARLTKGDDPGERVTADITLTRDDGSTVESSVVLTRQPDGRYERVLDGDALAASAEIRFRSADAETDRERVAFVEPPSVKRAAVVIEPPAYAAREIEPRAVDLGDGTDERAALRDPVLSGSSVVVEIELNESLGTDEGGIVERMVELSESARADPRLTIDPTDPRRWRLSWRMAGPAVLGLRLVDAHGIANPEEIAFRLESSEDRAPGCAVLTPSVDESVLATALVPVEIEARDDVGLAKFGLLITRRPGDGNGGSLGNAEPEAFGDSVTEVSGTTARRAEALDLAALSVRAGDALTLVAAAEDGFEMDGRRHERVTSAPRTIRIISETELGKQVRAQLSTIRRAAIRLDEQQGELLAATQNGRFDPAVERGQAQVSERLRAAGESLNDVLSRMDRNRVVDDELRSTLDQAADLLETASRASAGASESLRARREANGRPEEVEREAKAAEAAQEDVRAELEDLVKLLDRDEDSWAMGRAIDRLREELGELNRRTAETGKRTVGQRREELAPADRTALEGLATQQREAAQEAQELLDELRKRAESVERTDRARAEAMRDAAKAGEERRLQRNLEQAGEELRQNRIEQARANQQQAIDALEEMRQGLDDVRKARVEELRRALESLEQSIDRLIRVNEDELIELARVDGPAAVEPIAERAKAMARLSQNTRAVASEARAAGNEANPAARLLDRAADSHGGAVNFMRMTPPNLDEAKLAEERGLAFLQDARRQTRETRDQVERREAERKRAEIVAAYRKIHEKQVGVRDATVALRPKTDPAAPGEAPRLDRRGLIESRRLALAQGEVRSDLDGVRAAHDEVRESEAFSQAHELLGGWASEASERIGRGDLSDDTVAGQGLVISTLEQLIEAMNEQAAADENDRFQAPQQSDDQGQQGNGGNGQQQDKAIPPVTELKLLRGLQVQVLERTRRLDRRREVGGATNEIEAELRAVADLQSRLLKAASDVVRKIERPTGVGEEPQPGETPGSDGEAKDDEVDRPSGEGSQP